MCRNHRGFIDAVIAASKVGANVLFLNTAFSGPQLADVAKREKPKALIYDHEFEELIHDASRRRKRYIAWHEAEDGKPDDPRLEDLIEGGDTSTSRRRPSAARRSSSRPAQRARRRAPRARSRAASTRPRRCWR